MVVTGDRRRDAGQRFVAAYDGLSLYEVVRGVALSSGAARPDLLSQRAWDAARASSPHPDAPSAREICRQLRGSDGQPYPWRELLHLVFDETRETERVHIGRRGGESIADLLDDTAIYYALNRVAQHLQVRALSRDDYTRGRDELLAAAGRDSSALEALLPPHVAIEQACGSWTAALGIAGLERLPNTSQRARPSVPLVEAGVRFCRATGYLPTLRQVNRFARDHGFAVQAPSKTERKPWTHYLDLIRARIRELGLSEPPEYQPRIDKPHWPTPATPVESADPKYRPKTRWHRADAIVAVAAFQGDLPAGQEPSTDQYRRWSSWHEDRPSLDVINRHGGLRALLRTVRDPRAVAEAHERREPTEEEVQRRRREWLEQRLEHPTCMAIVSVIHEHAPVSALEISKLTGITKTTVNNWLAVIKEAGLVELTTTSPVARNVRYRPAGTTPTPEQAQRERVLELAARPRPQQVLALLREHGELGSIEIANLVGHSRAVVIKWIRPLKDAGLITEVVTQLGAGRRRITYQVTPGTQ